MTPTEQLLAWEKLIAEATPGPWVRVDTADYAVIQEADSPLSAHLAMVALAADANLIASAPTALSQAIAMVRELQAEVARKDEALARAVSAARGPFSSHSKYHEDSPFYGSDLTPDRSDYGRGKQAGREEAALAVQAALSKGSTNEPE